MTGGVDVHGVVGGAQRSRGAGGVGRIAPAQVGQHLVVVDGTDAAIDVLAHPAMGALLVGGGEEHLHGRIGKHHGTDVAALHHVVAGVADATLLVEQGLAHGGRGGHRAHGAVDLGSADGVGHLVIADEHAARHWVALHMPEGDVVGTGDSPQGRLVVERDAEVKYSTVQNWYPGDKEGRGGIYNFVTKRGLCRQNARLSWTQVETGSAITWKYPSCVLLGDNSVGEFYSVAMTNHFQQADTGTKMIHIGRNTRSRIVSKGISAGRSENSYRGLVKVARSAEGARNYSQCDSLLIGSACGAHTFPEIACSNRTAIVEHEATTSKISDEQLFYCNQRGLSTEDAVGLIVNGFAKEVMAKLPMEFAVEAQKLLSISLEGSVG